MIACNKADEHVSNNLEHDKISLLSSLRLQAKIYYIDIVSDYHITFNKSYNESNSAFEFLNYNPKLYLIIDLGLVNITAFLFQNTFSFRCIFAHRSCYDVKRRTNFYLKTMLVDN